MATSPKILGRSRWTSKNLQSRDATIEGVDSALEIPMTIDKNPASTVSGTMTVAQIVATENVSRSYVFKCLKDGSLPSHKLGRKRLAKIEHVRSWLRGE
jgi:excisionase family DNA binding protein